MKEHSKEVDTLNEKIADLEDGLKQEVENNIALEQYTRRENLRFNYIEEKEHEDCRAVVYNILEKELGVDTTKIRFCLLYTSPSPRDLSTSRMPSSA